MVETQATSYKSRCDWCGIEKDGSLGQNDFAVITIMDADYRKQRRNRSDNIADLIQEYSLFDNRPAGRTAEICPNCYESVRLFLRQVSEEKKRKI